MNTLAQSLQCSVCGVSGDERSFFRVCVPRNSKEYKYIREIRTDDKPYVCSAKCNTSALLNSSIPLKEVIGDTVPGRFLSDPYCELKAWDTSDSPVVKLREWVAKAPRFAHGLGFVGSVGRGKTCLAVALAYEARCREATVRYVDCAELNDQLATLRISTERQSYTYEEQLRTFYEQFFANKAGLNYQWNDKESRDKLWDVVILDDFTYLDFKNPLLWTLLQKFYNYKQTLIITANGNPKHWQDAGLDQRIVSRLKQMCVFTSFEGDDYREK